METIFIELTLIFIIATGLSVILRFLKLPTILAYIFTGLLIGPFAVLGDSYFQDEASLEALSKLGITLLLFILGLEMKVSELRSVGKVAAYTGIGQIVFTSLIGFVIALVFGYEARESLYIAIALTFSSTIVVVKLLSDKKELNSLYGKISIGFLLIQDFVAILALLLLNGIATGSEFSLLSFVEVMLKAIVVFGIVFMLSQTILPRIVHMLSNSLEILFSFSVAWAFGVALLISSDLIGLSIEIGGFLAGLALASSAESLQIASKIRTLRDFFIIIFFVHLGTTLHIDNLESSIIPAVLFSLFVLIGNPLIVLWILTALKYKARTGFLSGLTVAQISEFSLIVIFLGYELGHVSVETTTMITLVAIITFALSSYMIMNGDKLYDYLQPYLKRFERSHVSESDAHTAIELENHIIVVGVDQMGRAILKAFHDKKDQVLVVDFNPEVIKKLNEQGFSAIFGDIIEHEVMQQAGIHKARVVISTIPNLEDNVILIQSVKKSNADVEVIVNAERTEYRTVLEVAGADMVISPLDLAGQMLSKLVAHAELKIKGE